MTYYDHAAACAAMGKAAKEDLRTDIKILREQVVDLKEQVGLLRKQLQEQAPGPLDVGERKPEWALAALMTRQLKVPVSPRLLRLFLRENWSRVSLLAHAIHEAPADD